MKPTPATLQVDVLRAFFAPGGVQPVGACVELPYGLAVEMISAHKAREHLPHAPAAPAAEAAPEATQSADTPDTPDTPAKSPAPARRKAKDSTS
jgi:hypothetical protein